MFTKWTACLISTAVLAGALAIASVDYARAQASPKFVVIVLCNYEYDALGRLVAEIAPDVLAVQAVIDRIPPESRDTCHEVMTALQRLGIVFQPPSSTSILDSNDRLVVSNIGSSG